MISRNSNQHFPRSAPPSARITVVLCLVVLGAAMLGSARPLIAAGQAAAQPQRAAHPVRIGIYDSRAVAVAYARSKPFSQKMQALHRQHGEAEKAGDAKRTVQLQAQGEALQTRLHLQGFSTAPVDDVLDTVRDRLPELARTKNVAVITRAADFHADAVEMVDVTDDLVNLFEPDQQTLAVIKELRGKKPLAIEEAAKAPAK